MIRHTLTITAYALGAVAGCLGILATYIHQRIEMWETA